MGIFQYEGFEYGEDGKFGIFKDYNFTPRPIGEFESVPMVQIDCYGRRYVWNRARVNIAREDLEKILDLQHRVQELEKAQNSIRNNTLVKAIKILGENPGYFAEEMTGWLDHPGYKHLDDEENSDIDE